MMFFHQKDYTVQNYKETCENVSSFGVSCFESQTPFFMTGSNSLGQSLVSISGYL